MAGPATVRGASRELQSALPATSAARGRALLADAFVFAVALLTFSHAFTADYVMKDEMMLVGWAPAWPGKSPLDEAFNLWNLSGRWVGGLLSNLPAAFAADDPARLRLVRFTLVVILALVAVVTRRLLERSLRGPAVTTLLVLAIFAQAPFWSHAGYSVATFGSVSGLLLALAAFALAVPAEPGAGETSGPRIACAFACLAVVMQIHQGMALFGLVPLVGVVLVGDSRRSRPSWSLLAAMVVALVASAALYRWNLSILHSRRATGYDRGEQAMALATSPFAALKIALDPRHYWPAFRLWSFPYPFERVRELGPRTLVWAWRIMAAWVALVGVAAVLDARRSTSSVRQTAEKWAQVLACLGLAVFPILADSPVRIPHPLVRPHTSIVATGVVMVMGAWALRTISARWRRPARNLLALAVVALVATWCVGARSSLRRGLVAPGAAQLAFVRSAVAGEGPVRRILVVRPSRNGCVYEPCDGWSGLVAPGDGHVRSKGLPRWALALERGRIEPPPEVRILDRPPALPRPEGEVVVDWNEFVRAQARRKGIDWRSLQRVGGIDADRATGPSAPARRGPRPAPPAS
jgi:hypothetical protein